MSEETINFKCDDYPCDNCIETYKHENIDIEKINVCNEIRRNE